MHVTIVGAGPSGLMCALALAQHDVPVQIIEAAPTPITQTRAMFIQPRTLELWDRLGISDDALRRGSPVNSVRIWKEGREIGNLSIKDAFAGQTRFPHALGLPQDQTQRMLLDALQSYDHVLIRWGTKLTGLRQTADEVIVTVDGPDGEDTLRTRYLVAADGGSSTVRELLGIAMPGVTYELAELGADIELPPGLPRDAMVTSSSMARGVSVMPIGGDRFRVFGTLTPALAQLIGPQRDASSITLDHFVRWFREAFPYDPPPTTMYRAFAYNIHRRVADRFREHRVFLIGDAAHMNAPAGGQGINLGMGDGFNLGWKLALVCRGDAYPALLDSYEAERLPLAKRVVGAVDRVYRADMVSGGAFAALSNSLTSKLTGVLVRVPPLRDLIANLIGQTWISYRRSPLSADRGSRRGLRAGDRVPAHPALTRLGVDRMGVQALVFDGLAGGGAASLRSELTAALEQFSVHVEIKRVPRSERALHGLFGARQPLFALIRPDGYVLFRGQTEDDVAALGQFLPRWFTRRALTADADALHERERSTDRDPMLEPA